MAWVGDGAFCGCGYGCLVMRRFALVLGLAYDEIDLLE